jgi:hypothetical protein
MPRYYFNIRNGDEFKKDARGVELLDLGTVRRAALAKARKMLVVSSRQRRRLAQAEFEITDEGGVIVEAVRFSEADGKDLAPPQKK